MLKIERDELSAQLATVENILSTLPENDYVGRISFEARREEIEEQLKNLRDHQTKRAQVALYFGGDSVVGSSGIQAEFGTKAVLSFQDLISKAWSSIDGGQLSAMGPIPSRDLSQLHITNVMHGSFGFLLEEMDEYESLFDTPLTKATDEVASYIANFAGRDEQAFSKLLEELNPRVFQALRTFFMNLHKGGATLRLVEGERDDQFDRLAVERAWERAEASDIAEEKQKLRGTLLGVIPYSRRFEFIPDETGRVIKGTVADSFSKTYLDKMQTQQYSGRRWNASFVRKSVRKMGRDPIDHYTLLDLGELEEQAGFVTLANMPESKAEKEPAS